MKKLASMILALVMILALAVPSMAATTWNGTTFSSGNTIAVTAEYKTGSATLPSVKAVEISWTGDGKLTYTSSDTYTWNSNKTTYEKNTGDGTWADAKVEITVENRSSVDVTAAFAYSGTSGATITADCTFAAVGSSSFVDDTLTLAAAANAEGGTTVTAETDLTGSVKQGKVTATVSHDSGDFTSGSSSVSVGTITITLS